MTPIKFTVMLKPEVVDREKRSTNRIELQVEGVEELRDLLDEENISLSDDVQVAYPENRSAIDLEIHRTAFALESVSNHNLIVAASNGWFVVVSILDGGIMEYQVSNGLPHERSESFDTYWYDEAMKLFNEHSNKDVIDVEFTVLEVDLNVLRMIYSKICIAITNRCNGSFVSTRRGDDLAGTFDIDIDRNLRGTSMLVGWHDDDWDEDEDGENPHLYADGALMSETSTPARINGHTDCLDLALRTLFEIEELTIRDLSTDGDHNSCEAVFYVDEAGAYVRVAFN